MIEDFHLNEIKKDDLEDPKNRGRFIERSIRMLKSSYEYNKYQEYLDYSSRGVFQRVEQHFTPFYFSDIIEMILNKVEVNNGSITEFIISHEMMKLIYKGSIPNCFIPISIHHAITFEKSEDYIYSKEEFEKFKPFIEEYFPYMTNKHKEKLEKCIGRMEGKKTRDKKKKELVDILENRTYTIHCNRDDIEKDSEVLFFLSGKEVDHIYKELANTDRCPRDVKNDIKSCPYNECKDCNRSCVTIEECWKKYLKDDFQEDV